MLRPPLPLIYDSKDFAAMYMVDNRARTYSDFCPCPN